MQHAVPVGGHRRHLRRIRGDRDMGSLMVLIRWFAFEWFQEKSAKKRPFGFTLFDASRFSFLFFCIPPPPSICMSGGDSCESAGCGSEHLTSRLSQGAVE